MKRSTRLVSLFLLVTVIFVASCAGAARVSAGPAAVNTRAGELTQSLFARDPQGSLTEQAIQEILSAPLELDLPARVGLLPVVEAEDWRGPGPDYAIAPAGLTHMARNLPSQETFTLVTEMLPIPSGALGMEALREIAARYKLRYVVLYRENVRRRTRANAWAVGYATLVGALFLPGSTLEVDGYVEASLFDVKTGLLLFTVRRRVAAERGSNVWYQDDKLEALQARLADKVAGKLAGDVRRSLLEYKRATALENERRAPADAAPTAPTEGVAEMPPETAGTR